VKISLVVRGICGVRPGVQGPVENIRVKSIVGRFLEHSASSALATAMAAGAAGAGVLLLGRLDGPQPDRRVETLVEALNPTVKSQILGQIMAANLADEAQSWVLAPDGRYQPRPGGEATGNCSTATASSWKTPRCRAAARPAPRMPPLIVGRSAEFRRGGV
jgi:polyphosphate kinase